MKNFKMVGCTPEFPFPFFSVEKTGALPVG